MWKPKRMCDTDIIDIIDLSKLADRCLLEYEKLFMSSEMQASNLSKTCEGFRFSECDLESEGSLDEWTSDSESFSGLPGDLMSGQSMCDGNPEYCVFAGRKPLSLIIRKCNTPPVASSPAPAGHTRHTAERNECEINESSTRSAPSALAYSKPEGIAKVRSLSENCGKDNEQVVNAAGHINTGDFRRLSKQEERTIARNCILRSSERNFTPIVGGEFKPELSPRCTKSIDNEADVRKLNASDDNELCAATDDLSDERELNCDFSTQSASEADTKSVNCDDNDERSKEAAVMCGDGIANSRNTSRVSNALTACDSGDSETTCAGGIKEGEAGANGTWGTLPDELVTSGASFNCIPCEDGLVKSVNTLARVTNDKNAPLQTLSENCNYDLQAVSSPVKSLSGLPELDSFCEEQESSPHVDAAESLATPKSASNVSQVSSAGVKTNADGEQSSLLDDSEYQTSPLLFTSDDECLDDGKLLGKAGRRGLRQEQGEPEGVSQSAEHRAALTAARQRLRRLHQLLTGVPPPPAVTAPLYAVADMLRMLQEHQPPATGAFGTAAPWGWLQEARCAEWPAVQYLQHPGIQYNLGLPSEEYESCLQRLQQRCVGRETASSCSLWALPAAGTGRRAAAVPTGVSPGRRLSHLARRRKTFSSCNLVTESRLPALLSGSGAEHRMILMEATKKAKKERKSSQKKKNAASRSERAPPAKLNSSKRALFQSPAEDRRRTPRGKFRSASVGGGEPQRSRRALFVDSGAQAESAAAPTNPPSSRKRRLEEGDVGSGSGRKLARRSLFSDTPPGPATVVPATDRPRPQQTPRKLEQPAPGTAISSSHRKKLLWAVAEALKQRGVGLAHPQFRSLASALAARCRTHVPALVAQQRPGSSGGGTSDRLLALALTFVADVVRAVAEAEA